MGEWADLASMANNKRSSIGSKRTQIFQSHNFAITGAVFNDYAGRIEFTFHHSEPQVFLVETLFLLKILQSQSKEKGCWYFDEKLSGYQDYLATFLNAARREGMVRKFKISNRKNWFVIKSEDQATERLIHIVEPLAQLLSHVRTNNNIPSRNRADWKHVVEINKERSPLATKCHKIFNYSFV